MKNCDGGSAAGANVHLPKRGAAFEKSAGQTNQDHERWNSKYPTGSYMMSRHGNHSKYLFKHETDHN
eukprot:scaffold1220_cov259-Pinguiococcus_pyrenoidosus.AAC.133